MSQNIAKGQDETMMRTGIYVREPTTVTIRLLDPRSEKAWLYRYGQSETSPAIGSHYVERGIYMIHSSGELQIEVVGVATVTTVRGGKDPWPRPQLDVVALEPGATAESIQQFFTVSVEV